MPVFKEDAIIRWPTEETSHGIRIWDSPTGGISYTTGVIGEGLLSGLKGGTGGKIDGYWDTVELIEDAMNAVLSVDGFSVTVTLDDNGRLNFYSADPLFIDLTYGAVDDALRLIGLYYDSGASGRFEFGDGSTTPAPFLANGHWYAGTDSAWDTDDMVRHHTRTVETYSGRAWHRDFGSSAHAERIIDFDFLYAGRVREIRAADEDYYTYSGFNRVLLSSGEYLGDRATLEAVVLAARNNKLFYIFDDVDESVAGVKGPYTLNLQKSGLHMGVNEGMLVEGMASETYTRKLHFIREAS